MKDANGLVDWLIRLEGILNEVKQTQLEHQKAIEEIVNYLEDLPHEKEILIEEDYDL